MSKKISRVTISVMVIWYIDITKRDDQYSMEGYYYADKVKQFRSNTLIAKAF